MQKVTFLINSLAGGGAERALVNLLSNSAHFCKHYHVEAILLDREEQRYDLPMNIKVSTFNSKHSLLKSIASCWRFFKRKPADVVVSSLTRSNLTNVICSLVCGHRTILCEHAHTSGHHSKKITGFLAKLMIRTLYRHANHIICVSEGIKDDLTGKFDVDARKVSNIANPIDIEEILRLSTQPAEIPVGPYILGMGRLVESKNFPLLLAGFAKSNFTGRLVLLGQGPEMGALQELASNLNIQERVIFLGFRENPFPYLKAASAFVLASNGEGLPTSIIEALALGTAVISTDCRSGPSEILNEQLEGRVVGVEHAKYGILVPPNDVNLMSEAISLVECPAALAELKEKAKIGAGRYGVMKAVESYWAVIGACIKV